MTRATMMTMLLVGRAFAQTITTNSDGSVTAAVGPNPVIQLICVATPSVIAGRSNLRVYCNQSGRRVHTSDTAPAYNTLPHEVTLGPDKIGWQINRGATTPQDTWRMWADGTIYNGVFPGATLAMSVVGSTATQIALKYAAPNIGPCGVEVSESPTYQPLVRDVDPALFVGANLDVGAISDGTSRILVVGKRFSDTATDKNTYSRALQANTKHYARVTCSGSVGTTTVSTSNIPANMTYSDGPQVDPANPGQWKMPTRLEDRQQTIIDPQTGALLHAVSIADEGGLPNFNGIFLGYGGFTRQCENKLVGPTGGPLGFICTFLRYGQGGGVSYFIVPTTGEVRMLGSVPITGGGALGSVGSDLRTYGPDNSGNTIWENYVGNFVPSKELPTDGWHTYSATSIEQMVHDFEPAFPLSGFNCGRPWAGAGQYVLVVCGTGQDLPGWLAVLYGGDGRSIVPGCPDGNACPRIVAVVDVFNTPTTLNCTLHNVQQMGDVVSINVQTFPNVPRCAAMGNMVYWRFKTDPHGAALVVDQFFDGGGHWDHGPLGRVSEDGGGWAAVIGSPPEDHLNQPLTLRASDSPFFAGARGLSWGSTTSKHPSYHQIAGVAPPSETGWLLDMIPFDGGQFYSPASGATPISGQLFKYNLSSEQPSTSVLSRKQVPTLGVSGGRSLIDVSGPGSVIGDTALDSFKYCVVALAGECRVGSTAGDIFVNAPDVSTLQCAGSDGPVPDRFDLCVGNLGGFQQGMMQVDLTGSSQPRAITYGLAGIRNSFFYSTAKSLPDASWALFNWGVIKQGFGNITNVWMAKLPPTPALDNVDRTTFVPATVTLTPPANLGIVSAILSFGYLEQGKPDQHYCTSRREACVVNSPTIDQASPFKYAVVEAPTGIPCQTTCAIQIPVLPMHVAYYQASYMDATGKVVAQGIRGVAVESAIASVTK